MKHFVEAQEPVYPQVLEELRAGRKRSHWMWFIFPQLRGLGSSAMADRYALSSLDEAREYLQHPLLGNRLRECTSLVLGHADKTAESIFGYPDYLKFRSCMTLFREVTKPVDVFTAALLQFFNGEPDTRTLLLLAQKQE